MHPPYNDARERQTIPVPVHLPMAEANFLTGLDEWLRLGILSHDEVKNLARTHLVCALSSATASSPTQIDSLSRKQIPVAYLLWALGFLFLCGLHRLYTGRVVTGVIWLLTLGLFGFGQFLDLFLIPGLVRQANREANSPTDPPVESAPAAPLTPPRRTPPIMQSLIAELSVRWLLFLGLFLVIVSSGVLAASQWQHFSASGQYLVLFVYTVAFWGASVWTSRQANLHLTAGSLHIGTLLLIPVNVWAMDGLRLWQSPISGILAGIATVLLVAISVSVLARETRPHPWLLATGVLLSVLHWGWAWDPFPLVAVYLGVIATVGVGIYYSPAVSPFSPESEPAEEGSPEDSSLEGRENPTVAGSPVRLSPMALALIYGCLLLLVRAFWAARVPLADLGLACGLGGWMLCWWVRLTPAQVRWWMPGVGLLILGWAVAVRNPFPWQAVGVSGLGLVVLADRLSRWHRVADFVGLFLWGLQTVLLLRRLVPEGWRMAVVSWVAGWAGSAFLPWALLGVGLLPYLGVTLRLGSRFRQRQHRQLAKVADILALGLGSSLTLISLPNPGLRLVNLLVSGMVLFRITQQRPAGYGLIVLTHTALLGAGLAAIAWGIPDLSLTVWAGILLIIMVVEWAMAVGETYREWRESAWTLGLGLAGLSFVLLEGEVLRAGWNYEWSWIWLATPAMLTTLASAPRFAHQRSAVWLSVGGLLLLVLLSLGSDSARLTSLGSATLLMLLNGRLLPNLWLTVLTVGYGVFFVVDTASQVLPPDITLPQELCWLAGLPWLLWGIRQAVTRYETTLAKYYQRALDGWGIATALLPLLSLTGVSYLETAEPNLGATHYSELMLAASILLVAILYRCRQNTADWLIYGLVWVGELALLNGLRAGDFQGSQTTWAWVNLGLGLLIQVVEAIWIERTRPAEVLFSFGMIPILLVGVGWLEWHRLENWGIETGFASLVLGLVVVHVGRWQAQPGLFRLPFAGSILTREAPRGGSRSWVWSGLLLFSLAAHEILLYFLAQAKGGEPGDGVVILAGLNGILAFVYRYLPAPVLRYLRLGSDKNLAGLGHLHWGLGTLLGLIVVRLTFLSFFFLSFLSLSATGEWLCISVLLLLAGYALWQGRTQSVWIPLGFLRWWVIWSYLGLGQLWVAWLYGGYLILPESLFLPWVAAFACPLAYGLYRLPWSEWGWDPQPFRNVATTLPILIVFVTAASVSIPSLLIVGAFYGWVSLTSGQIRWSYLSLALATLAIWRLLGDFDLEEPLFYFSPLALSLLYIAQMDPQFQEASAKDRRHWLRCLATGMVCLSALIETDLSFWSGLRMIGLGLLVTVAGLGLRVRAYLYVGSLTFIVAVIRQTWLFIGINSLLLWSLGIGVGVGLIWVAATFETRREQVSRWLETWLEQQDPWE